MWELTPTVVSALQLLGLAFVLSAAIGAEREYRHKDAGLRTHILVGLGSALFTLVSAYGFADLTGDRPADPGRIAAQIVTGIGFLGAGVIFTRSNTVHGLTTAATIWLAAAIGMACGAGLPLLAVAATIGYLVFVSPLGLLAERMSAARRDQVLQVRYRDGRGVLREVLAVTSGLGLRTVLLSSKRCDDQSGEVVVRFMGRIGPQDLVAALSEIEGVAQIEPATDPER